MTSTIAKPGAPTIGRVAARMLLGAFLLGACEGFLPRRQR
jgi:hypothetical protein